MVQGAFGMYPVIQTDYICITGFAYGICAINERKNLMIKVEKLEYTIVISILKRYNRKHDVSNY